MMGRGRFGVRCVVNVWELTTRVGPLSFTRPLSSWRPPPQTPTGTAADEGEGSSGVYRFARKYAAPPSVMVGSTAHLYNSATFIGTVLNPLKQYATKSADKFGVYTFLRVRTCAHSHSSFEILLAMWDELAHIAQQHLKPNDYIYVSGQLEAYSMANLQGVERVRYKVTARELNYVKQSDLGENAQGAVTSKMEGESPSDKNRNRLLMWQVMFANPSEWHDLRKNKTSQTQPDFRHKSSGEALWLHPNDPPWIRKQLELLDSNFSGAMDSETSKFVTSRYL